MGGKVGQQTGRRRGSKHLKTSPSRREASNVSALNEEALWRLLCHSLALRHACSLYPITNSILA